MTNKTVVLAIDDDATTRIIVNKLFNRYGGGRFELVCASSFDEAIDTGATPHVVLLDLTLKAPDGTVMSAGVDTVRLSRAEWDAPVVVLTATPLVNGDRKHLIDAGASSAFWKNDVLKPGERDGISVLFRALRRAAGAYGHINAEKHLTSAIKKLESSSWAERVVKWTLTLLLTGGAGGGVYAWRGCAPVTPAPVEAHLEAQPHQPLPPIATTPLIEYQTRADAVVESRAREQEIRRIEAAVNIQGQKIDTLTTTVSELVGYVRRLGETTQRRER